MAKKLPSGLQNFRNELENVDDAAKLLARLERLPEAGGGILVPIRRHADMHRSIEAKRVELKQLEDQAAKLARSAFDLAVAGWSIDEIQKATGYNDDESDVIAVLADLVRELRSAESALALAPVQDRIAARNRRTVLERASAILAADGC